MKRLFQALMLTLSLSACSTQGINQNVNIDLGKLADRLSPTAAPSSAPGQVSTSPGAPASPQATAAPALAVGVDIFLTGIPRPEQAATYLRTEIKAATEKWKLRYDKSRSSPFDVSKMYLDAMLLASSNKELARELLQVIAPMEDPYEKMVAEQVVYKDLGLRKEAAIAKLYTNVEVNERTGKVVYQDFNNRTLQVIKPRTTLDAPLVPVSRPDELAPESPKDGDSVSFHIISGGPAITDIKGSAIVFCLYEDSGWKLDLLRTTL